MAGEPRAPRLAVLIDADNASARIAPGLFEEVARIGEANVRRIYGDFSTGRLKAWADILQRYAIEPRQSFAYTTGKNASDIALVIDAMDLLHSGRFDGFCLVSSDSDFTRLATRIREDSHVYGFGEQKTPESFRQACHRFIYTENLLPGAPAADEPERGDERTDSIARPATAAVQLIRRAIAQLDEDDEGWVKLGGVGERLLVLAPDFDPRTFGHGKLVTLVERTGQFDVRREQGRSVMIRAKVKR